jgi:hypothetical protein
MKSFVVFVSVIAAATAFSVAHAQSSSVGATAVVASKGKMLVAANGARLGSVYRVAADGSPQIIIDGRMVTIPANTLTEDNGRLVTSLSKNEVADLH